MCIYFISVSKNNTLFQRAMYIFIRREAKKFKQKEIKNYLNYVKNKIFLIFFHPTAILLLFLIELLEQNVNCLRTVCLLFNRSNCLNKTALFKFIFSPSLVFVNLYSPPKMSHTLLCLSVFIISSKKNCLMMNKHTELLLMCVLFQWNFTLAIKLTKREINTFSNRQCKKPPDTHFNWIYFSILNNLFL